MSGTATRAAAVSVTAAGAMSRSTAATGGDLTGDVGGVGVGAVEASSAGVAAMAAVAADAWAGAASAAADGTGLVRPPRPENWGIMSMRQRKHWRKQAGKPRLDLGPY